MGQMSNQYNSKSFKALQAEWYKKLKDENFKDIEDEKEDRLKVWHSFDFSRKNKADFDAKEQYFSLCLEFGREYPFESDITQSIWMLHSEGMSVRAISQNIRQYSDKRGFKKSHISNIIRRLVKIMEGYEWKKTFLKKIS